MKLWGQKSEAESQSQIPGGNFEEAAARVSAGSDEEVTRNALETAAAIEEGESLAIRPAWANATARALFLLPSKILHPAWALTKEEARPLEEPIGEMMGEILGKWLPSQVSSWVNKYPKTADGVSALVEVVWLKMEEVSEVRAEEARMAAAERRQRAEVEALRVPAVASVELPPDPPVRPKAGERGKDGVLVI